MNIEEQINEILVKVANISIAADGDEYRAFIKEANTKLQDLITKETKQARIDELKQLPKSEIGKLANHSLKVDIHVEDRLEELNKE